MGNKNTLKHIFEVALSNCTTILSGIIVGFIVPKLLSVEGYGFYKTFTLYTTYLGLFNLGIIDGIVLDYGGVDYQAIERPVFRCYFRWYLSVHVFFAILFLLGGIFIADGEYKYIIIMLSINMIAVNLTGYFQQISQITQRFKEYSLRRILQSICNILIVVFMFLKYRVSGEVSYKYYITAMVLVNIILTFWYIYTYKDISIGESMPMREKTSNIKHLIKIGFPLLFANLCSTLILTLDRQFVNVLFDTSTYAVYAFAYSMLALVTVATSAIATVLYPTLKRTTEETMKENFSLLVSTMLIIIFGMETLYYPLRMFIFWFLPKYTESLIIFRIIFPGIAISSTITVVMHNYYKALGQNLVYFKKSIVVLVLSALANGIAYFIFKTTISISIASIITMIFWYIYVERYFVQRYKYDGNKNMGYLIIMMIAFYGITAISNISLSAIVYVIAYLTITFLLFKTTLNDIKKKFLNG